MKLATLFIALACQAKAAPIPVTGSPELPVRYLGPQLAKPNSPDGGMPYSPGVQLFEIARADRDPEAPNGSDGMTYQHHMDMACWNGRLYSVWDRSPRDEDTVPCHVMYSTSTDGVNWDAPKHLFPPNEAWNLRFHFYLASNGRMLAFACRPVPFDGPKFFETHKTSMLVREILADHSLGPIFTLLKPGENGPPMFDTSADAGFTAACRDALNNRLLLEQQDYGVFLGDRRMKWHDPGNWPGGKVPGTDATFIFGKAFCFYKRPDGAIVGLCKLGYATLSTDGGLTWSKPIVPEGIVAGGGKIWGQATPDKRFAMVYPPQFHGPRIPMVVTSSEDGITFKNMRTVHGEVPPTRYCGIHKGIGPQYLRGVPYFAGDTATVDPKAIFGTYSMNKEDIWVCRIPVPILPDAVDPVNDTFDGLEAGPRVPEWNTYSPKWAPVSISAEGKSRFLELTDREPADYARAIRTFPPSASADISFDVTPGQATGGPLEIEVLGDQNCRPVRLVFDDKGGLSTTDGTEKKDFGAYEAGRTIKFEISVRTGKFQLSKDRKVLLKKADFAEKTLHIYALSFRTGVFREKVAPMAREDMKDVDEPVPAASWRIDNVIIKPKLKTP